MNVVPDKWTLFLVDTTEEGEMLKVFATWSGSCTEESYWRINSGVVKIEYDEDYYYFYGHSGSCYQCHLESVGVAGLNNSGVHKTLSEQLVAKEVSIGEYIRSYDTPFSKRVC